MRYFTSDTHFGHPLVTALRGFLNNGRLRAEYRGKALGRDIVLSCERLARGEGKGRVWCTVHAKALPVQQFFKALRYRNLKPAEQENGTVPRDEVVFEHTLG